MKGFTLKNMFFEQNLKINFISIFFFYRNLVENCYETFPHKLTLTPEGERRSMESQEKNVSLKMMNKATEKRENKWLWENVR